MIPNGTQVIAWTRTLGPIRGQVRSSAVLPSGRRIYTIAIDGDDVGFQIDEIAVFVAPDASASQVHREIGTS